MGKALSGTIYFLKTLGRCQKKVHGCYILETFLLSPNGSGYFSYQEVLLVFWHEGANNEH